MFLPDEPKCSVCQEIIRPGERMVIEERGTLSMIGGLGYYKDKMTLYTKTVIFRHERCKLD